MTGCVFCAIVAGRGAAHVVASSPLSLAFCDLRQPHPTGAGAHLLVVPRRHVETIDRLAADDAADLMRLGVQVAAALRSEFGDEGLSLWQSNGPGAFQEVPHVHLHLLTRRIDDRLLRIYPDAVPEPAPWTQLDAIARRLRTRLNAA